ncbi:MAG: hypothetical protein ACTSQF_14365 [Candidatus Heimdallarchaeaceae archaeon]
MTITARSVRSTVAKLISAAGSDPVSVGVGRGSLLYSLPFCIVPQSDTSIVNKPYKHDSAVMVEYILSAMNPSAI